MPSRGSSIRPAPATGWRGGRRRPWIVISASTDEEVRMSEPEKVQAPNEFLRQAGERRTGLLADFLDFLRDNKKWWLLPIVIVMLLVGLLVLLGGTGLAPFIYTLF